VGKVGVVGFMGAMGNSLLGRYGGVLGRDGVFEMVIHIENGCTKGIG
jgi:hypothetical protein